MFDRSRRIALIFLLFGLKTVVGYSICPEGYCRHSNNCFLVVGLKVSWIDARSYCKVLGGSLMTVSSQEIHNNLKGALRKYDAHRTNGSIIQTGTVSPGKFWLDITDILNPTEWRHMEKRTTLTYTNWDTRKSPSNETDDKHCVAVSEKNDYKWTAEDCGRKLNFVCYSTGTTRNYYVGDFTLEC